MPTKKYGPRTKAKPKNLGYARKAYKEAADLGELKLIKPAQLRVDGSPALQEGQVYVTKAGTKYHPYWCEIIAAKWDSEGKGILVTRLEDVGGRQACRSCTIV
ncbi:hypothetical protein [Arthrobacter sp. AD-310]